MDPLFIRKSYDWGWTLGHVAAATGMFEVLEWIADLDVRSLGRTNDYGMTPMHYAAESNSVDVAIAMLDAGANIDDTPVIPAAYEED